MRKVFFLLFLLVCTSSSVLAQDEYNKVEFFGGFSHNRVDSDFNGFSDDRVGFNGFNTSITANVSRYVGFKFDFAGHYNKQNFNAPPVINFNVRTSLYNYLGGIQIKDNSKEKKVKPFAHFLAGGATARIRLTSSAVPSTLLPRDSDTGFAAVAGGGLDIRAGKRFDIRVFQVDYNLTRFDDRTQNNVRIGFGIVIH